MNTPKQLSLFDAQITELSQSIRSTTIDGETYFSILDVFAHYGGSKGQQNATQEWQKAKRFLKKQGFDSSIEIIQLQFPGERQRKTPVATFEVFLRIAQVAEFKNWEDLRRFMSQAAVEKFEAIAAYKRQSQIQHHIKAGLGDRPEVRRLQDRDMNITVFKSLKSTIAKVCENPRWGHIFNTEYNAMFGQVAAQLELTLQTKSIRDALPSLQLTALTYAERTLQAMLEAQDRLDNDTVINMVDQHVRPIGQHLRQTCDLLGIHHVTGQPLLRAVN